VGVRFPLHCTANGKAILACFSQYEASLPIDRSLAGHREYTLRSRTELHAEIEEVRRTQIAYDLEEHAIGIKAVGTTTLDVFSRPLAVSIPVPAQRFDDKKEFLTNQLLLFRHRIFPVVAG
jgi:DNA-binding IclR family transcriptional regulator